MKIYNTDMFLYLKKNTIFFKYSFFYFFIKYAKTYSKLFEKITFDTYKFVKKKKNKNRRIFYHLILTSRNEKLFINFTNHFQKNYLSISNGLFIKYFEKKKSFRKNKIIRTIVFKYLRKFFLLLNLPQIILILKKNPTYFLEFLTFFHQLIPYKFNEPVTNKEITDTNSKLIITKFVYFVFLNTQSYIRYKKKKKGRIKRKIFRKLILKNKIID